VKKAVTTNVCEKKSSYELFPLATTHAKLAYSGSGKVVIARYSIPYLFQNVEVLPLSVGYWKISSLF